MAKDDILPPGKHPTDQPIATDAVAGHMERITTNLVWIDQYRLNFEHLRTADPVGAERELAYLRHATVKALEHVKRLTELLLAGHTIDRSKKIPRNLELPPGAGDRGKETGERGERGRKGDMPDWGGKG